MSALDCQGCIFADWEKTDSGRLHPSGDGRCRFVYELPPLPGSMYWTTMSSSPKPSGGRINRREPLNRECPTFKPGDDQKPELTVFGGCFDGKRREIVAAKSMAAAIKLFQKAGAIGSAPAMRKYCSDTGNQIEIEIAMSKPGVVFKTSSLMGRKKEDYKEEPFRDER